MPPTSLHCPNCLAVLKPAKPIPQGARVKCPKCKGVFAAGEEPEAVETDEPDTEPRSRPEGRPERKKSRDELPSREAPSRRTGRPSRAEDEAPAEKKRIGPRQTASRDLLLAGIAAGVGVAFVFPILIMPAMFGLLVLVTFAIGIFGFVMGCLRAGQERHFVAFDYLTFLGPFRWVLAVGFFGFYFMGYLLLWTIAQIMCAVQKPKAMLPWFGLQAFAMVLILIGSLTAAVSNRLWGAVQLGLPAGPQAAVGPGRAETPGPQAAGPGVAAPPAQKKEPAPEPEPPALTGDRETDRLLARVGGNNGDALRDAANRLAGMQPNEHRPIVAKKLAEVLQTADAASRPPLIRALGAWATAAEAPVLIRFLSEGDANTRNEALKAVGKLRDERAVEPAIRCLGGLETTYHAEQALKDMGPVAEPSLLAALNQPGSKDIRIPILRILKEIGTAQSIPTLEAASRGDFSIQGSAQAALEAVRKRVRQ